MREAHIVEDYGDGQLPSIYTYLLLKCGVVYDIVLDCLCEELMEAFGLGGYLWRGN